MSNIKKIIGVVLALVMAFSAATVAFAVSNDDAAFTVAVTSDKDQLAAGESATVTVKLTTNFYASTFSIPVFYDNAKLEVSGATTSITDATVASNSSAYPDDLYAGTGLTSADKGVVAVIYVAQVGDDIAMYNNTTVMTFTVTAKDDAEGTDVIGCLEASLKKSFAEGQSVGALYAGKDEDNDDDIMDDTAIPVANATLTSATVSFASVGGDPELVLTAAGEAAGTIISTDYCTGDGFTGCVMGIDTLGTYTMEAISDNVEAVNGYMVVNTDESNGIETTGTVIELYDNDDNLVATYVFIYFGDLDKDGAITGSDATICNDYELTYEGLDEEYMLLAADLDGDTAVTGSDGTICADFELTYDPEASFFDTQATIAAYYA